MVDTLHTKRHLDAIAEALRSLGLSETDARITQTVPTEVTLHAVAAELGRKVEQDISPSGMRRWRVEYRTERAVFTFVTPYEVVAS